MFEDIATHKESIDLAGCVVLDELGEILLLHRVRKHRQELELPGGKVEAGERKIQAAIREVREETSLSVSVVKFLGRQPFTAGTVNYQYYWYQAVRSNPNDQPQIMEPDKHDEVGFYNLYDQSLESRPISQNLRNLLIKVRSGEVTFVSV